MFFGDCQPALNGMAKCTDRNYANSHRNWLGGDLKCLETRKLHTSRSRNRFSECKHTQSQQPIENSAVFLQYELSTYAHKHKHISCSASHRTYRQISNWYSDHQISCMGPAHFYFNISNFTADYTQTQGQPEVSLARVCVLSKSYYVFLLRILGFFASGLCLFCSCSEFMSSCCTNFRVF